MLRSDHVLSGRLSEVKTREIFKSSAPKVFTVQLFVVVCVYGGRCRRGKGGGIDFSIVVKLPFIKVGPTGLTESFYDGDSDCSNQHCFILLYDR